MPKFNPIFTFSKIDLNLTKKSSCFIFSNYFIKKLLEFYIVSSSVFNMFPFKKRNCVSVLRSMYFHTLHSYNMTSSDFLQFIPLFLWYWHL